MIDELDRVNKEYTMMNDNLQGIQEENKQLRAIGNIPDNFGKDQQKDIIRFKDRETVFEYKRLVKVLQQDNYELEKERALLKHKNKQYALLLNDKEDSRYKDLTRD